ncbi:3-methyl-2-oxobutanoate dehydrogenase subunit VorB [Lutibacter maritimus]|uniref:2-oxoglutarate ferredoxin oxidoreductase subunit alpha n=1 Tax=Lutibacter maritimus TaxID=593133 RepID=A0A1I6SAV0_9FLAO|nr:3-methyl-2-oxobutanoate dehydrogenase subunit VorB [Lutibacter maritimus]SFS74095.1 2-oxoglutarate ferredoxin oxidoreductase subunit alpha [Lutibacter maritimus]
MSELKLMKGNEALAEAAIRAGADAYFGYPITPQSEVIEYLMTEQPEKRTGMVVLQAESEIAAINMVYGAASTGKKVMTSSSSPGISLKLEGISYLAGAELPAVIVNVVRGGPGLGTIQPSQADYFQSVKGGGHGDYKLYVLAPASVQEMSDFVEDAFDIAFKYRAPVLILSDGLIGQMMEKVQLKDQKTRLTNEELIEKYGNWAVTGRKNRERNIITSLDLQSEKMEARVHRLMKKYEQMEKEDLRYEKILCDDADYLIVAYGSSARISQKAIELARKKGIKAGLLRPITLFPYPKQPLFELADQVKGILSVELNAGQMIEDVKLSVEHKVPVEHFGRTGGIIHTPEEVLEALEQKIINNERTRHHKTRESSIL